LRQRNRATRRRCAQPGASENVSTPSRPFHRAGDCQTWPCGCRHCRAGCRCRRTVAGRRPLDRHSNLCGIFDRFPEQPVFLEQQLQGLLDRQGQRGSNVIPLNLGIGLEDFLNAVPSRQKPNDGTHGDPHSPDAWTSAHDRRIVCDSPQEFHDPKHTRRAGWVRPWASIDTPQRVLNMCQIAWQLEQSIS